MSEYNFPSQENNDGDCVKLAEIVRTLRERRGLSQEELGRRIGISKAAISSIEIGRTKSLRGHTLAALCREFGITPDELTGKKIHGRGELSYIRPVTSDTAYNRRIPVLGTAMADASGTWLALDPARAGGIIDYETADPAAYSVRVSGDAYHPRIKSGEFIVCEPGHEVGPGDEVLVKLVDGRSIVREYAYEGDGAIVFHAVNNGSARRTFMSSEIVEMHFIAAICKPSRYRES
jgi:transcriptional regulator with XRE-family HTH domain